MASQVAEKSFFFGLDFFLYVEDRENTGKKRKFSET